MKRGDRIYKRFPDNKYSKNCFLAWRNGERWLHENGKWYRLLDIAPHLEAKFMLEHGLRERRGR